MIELIIIFIIVSLIGVMVSSLTSNKSGDCSKISDLYENRINPNIQSIANIPVKHLLRDYTIKSAYNACALDNFKKGYVELCALDNCINQGARLLDFEIYSIDGKPCVAASSNIDNEPTTKGTYNYIDFHDTMLRVSTTLLNSPAPDDPLLLHFRIKIVDDSLIYVYDEIAKVLRDAFGTKLLTTSINGYENNGKNLGEIPIVDLMNKVVIIVDGTNPLYKETELFEYTNMASGTHYLQQRRYDDIYVNATDDDITYIEEHNKLNMTICMPTKGKYPVNPDMDNCINRGIQIIAMCFQSNDENMIKYNKYFDNVHKSFVLKNDKYRTSDTTTVVPPVDTSSLASRTVKIGGNMEITI
uniref:PI-PLC Y-box domain-containing protein n=1 Tax=viral metagenome TaxID=1070528 RepID=A0A6C0BTQ0_9ZZZZ